MNFVELVSTRGHMGINSSPCPSIANWNSRAANRKESLQSKVESNKKPIKRDQRFSGEFYCSSFCTFLTPYTMNIKQFKGQPGLPPSNIDLVAVAC